MDLLFRRNQALLEIDFDLPFNFLLSLSTNILITCALDRVTPGARSLGQLINFAIAVMINCETFVFAYICHLLYPFIFIQSYRIIYNNYKDCQ